MCLRNYVGEVVGFVDSLLGVDINHEENVR